MKTKIVKLADKLWHYYNANLFRSFIVNLKVNANQCRPLPVLFFGKSKSVISRSAKININSGSLDFNTGYKYKDPFPGFFVMKENSELNIDGDVKMRSGIHLIISENAKLTIGSGHFNRDVKIKCFNNITIGHQVAISENVTIWDSNAHTILRCGYVKSAPVKIGDHVWIGVNVIILKGVTIGNNVIIAAGSVVNKDVPSDCLIAGNPAKIIRTGVSWKL